MDKQPDIAEMSRRCCGKLGVRQLAGSAEGRLVHVLGCGPSLHSFEKRHESDIVIGTNTAVLCQECDAHIIVEKEPCNQDWWQQMEPFGGISVYGHGIATMGEAVAPYRTDEWWRKVIWVRRETWRLGAENRPELHQYRDGLFTHEKHQSGTVLLCAIHLAKIMQGERPSEICVWGGELMIRDKDQQHWDDYNPYKLGDNWNSMKKWGEMHTTDGFAYAAYAIREIVEHSNVTLYDCSDGLLGGKYDGIMKENIELWQ